MIASAIPVGPMAPLAAIARGFTRREASASARASCSSVRRAPNWTISNSFGSSPSAAASAPPKGVAPMLERRQQPSVGADGIRTDALTFPVHDREQMLRGRAAVARQRLDFLERALVVADFIPMRTWRRRIAIETLWIPRVRNRRWKRRRGARLRQDLGDLRRAASDVPACAILPPGRRLQSRLTPRSPQARQNRPHMETARLPRRANGSIASSFSRLAATRPDLANGDGSLRSPPWPPRVRGGRALTTRRSRWRRTAPASGAWPIHRAFVWRANQGRTSPFESKD